METITYALSIEYKKPPTLAQNQHIINALTDIIRDGMPFPNHPLNMDNINSINIFKEKKK